MGKGAQVKADPEVACGGDATVEGEWLRWLARRDATVERVKGELAAAAEAKTLQRERAKAAAESRKAAVAQLRLRLAWNKRRRP